MSAELSNLASTSSDVVSADQPKEPPARFQYDRVEMLKIFLNPLSKVRPDYLSEEFDEIASENENGPTKLWKPDLWIQDIWAKEKQQNSSNQNSGGPGSGQNSASNNFRPARYSIQRTANGGQGVGGSGDSLSQRRKQGVDRLKAENKDGIVLSPQRRSFGAGCQAPVSSSSTSSNVGGGGSGGSGGGFSSSSSSNQRRSSSPAPRGVANSGSSGQGGGAGGGGGVGGGVGSFDSSGERGGATNHQSASSSARNRRSNNGGQMEVGRDRDHQSSGGGGGAYERGANRSKTSCTIATGYSSRVENWRDRSGRSFNESRDSRPPRRWGNSDRCMSGNHNRSTFAENDLPEWATEGPSDVHDTIELRGFDEDLSQKSESSLGAKDDSSQKEPTPTPQGSTLTTGAHQSLVSDQLFNGLPARTGSKFGDSSSKFGDSASKFVGDSSSKSGDSASKNILTNLICSDDENYNSKLLSTTSHDQEFVDLSKLIGGPAGDPLTADVNLLNGTTSCDKILNEAPTGSRFSKFFGGGAKNKQSAASTASSVTSETPVAQISSAHDSSSAAAGAAAGGVRKDHVTVSVLLNSANQAPPPPLQQRPSSGLGLVESGGGLVGLGGGPSSASQSASALGGGATFFGGPPATLSAQAAAGLGLLTPPNQNAFLNSLNLNLLNNNGPQILAHSHLAGLPGPAKMPAGAMNLEELEAMLCQQHGPPAHQLPPKPAAASPQKLAPNFEPCGPSTAHGPPPGPGPQLSGPSFLSILATSVSTAASVFNPVVTTTAPSSSDLAGKQLLLQDLFKSATVSNHGPTQTISSATTVPCPNILRPSKIHALKGNPLSDPNQQQHLLDALNKLHIQRSTEAAASGHQAPPQTQAQHHLNAAAPSFHSMPPPVSSVTEYQQQMMTMAILQQQQQQAAVAQQRALLAAAGLQPPHQQSPGGAVAFSAALQQAQLMNSLRQQQNLSNKIQRSTEAVVSGHQAPVQQQHHLNAAVPSFHNIPLPVSSVTGKPSPYSAFMPTSVLKQMHGVTSSGSKSLLTSCGTSSSLVGSSSSVAAMAAASSSSITCSTSSSVAAATNSGGGGAAAAGMGSGGGSSESDASSGKEGATIGQSSSSSSGAVVKALMMTSSSSTNQKSDGLQQPQPQPHPPIAQVAPPSTTETSPPTQAPRPIVKQQVGGVAQLFSQSQQLQLSSGSAVLSLAGAGGVPQPLPPMGVGPGGPGGPSAPPSGVGLTSHDLLRLLQQQQQHRHQLMRLQQLQMLQQMTGGGAAGLMPRVMGNNPKPMTSEEYQQQMMTMAILQQQQQQAAVAQQRALLAAAGLQPPHQQPPGGAVAFSAALQQAQLMNSLRQQQNLTSMSTASGSTAISQQSQPQDSNAKIINNNNNNNNSKFAS